MTVAALDRERAAAALEASRTRSLTLTDVAEPELLAQHNPLMSPLVWDLAHVGNYEELWLLRALDAAHRPVLAGIDELYDAFLQPRATRPALPLLSPEQSRRYLAEVRGRTLDLLDATPLDDETNPLTFRGLVYAMVAQHEHQHDETMLATHQLRAGPPLLRAAPPAPGRDVRCLSRFVDVPAGPFTLGTDTDPWAYDNERGASVQVLPAYQIERFPVTNTAYQAFIADGGYDDPRWWSPAGWEHRRAAGLVAPLFWQRDPGGGWLRRRFGVVEPLPPDEPVQHVCFHEAAAYARWSGARLPTEAEWEKACGEHRYPWGATPPDPARATLGGETLGPSPVGAHPAGASPYGCEQLLGGVWEWTSSAFGPYPGFVAFPYPEYSAVFFGDEYRVLRGGSWATHPDAVRSTFRNWDYPIRRQIFAGLRCARDVPDAAGA
ncbi:MAG: hypothetical protein JWM48_3252 [Mycobacterium sp.]|nr:hypothetical protein [Mycobacterium sp.]